MLTNFRNTISVAGALAACLATPALAQDAPADTGSANDIIVTAQRIEQRLQDVPISIVVVNQAQITNNNITSAKDLATITPGLQINSRYGSDSTNFSIRGFTQEQRTSATVGTYFADVVAPRGSGGTFGGDGAGPGALFDLQNVQVLKGPQGTLQGRNVTGGAVLLVPVKPSDRFEGYVEGSIGDYKMRRIQAVVNIPLADTFKVRLGLDHQTRDGYLKNIGTLGDGKYGNHGMGDVDYWAGRVSVVADVTPDLENYIIATYSHSKSNGVIPKLLSCNGVDAVPGSPTQFDLLGSQTFGVLTAARCNAQLAREAGKDFWTVENRLPDSASRLEQWQVINTTTFVASDTLTIKNIASFAEFRQLTNLDLFGNYYIANGLTPAQVTSPAQVTGFAYTHANPFTGRTNGQSSFVEELRFQGNIGDGKLIWQAGGYMERNDPIGFSGVQTATGTACLNIDALACVAQPGYSLGSVNFQLSKTIFTDYAFYGQFSYKITPKLTLTAGARYTWDKQNSIINIQRITTSAALGSTSTCANQTAPGAGVRFPIGERYARCNQRLQQKSDAPTWTVGLDYKPIDDILGYIKYSRGYRAGGLSLFGPDSVQVGATINPNAANLQPYQQEKVDAYEVGAKTSWHGSIPGSFNVAGFYNKFANQQLLLGAVVGTTPTALVANAGKSRLYGAEADLNVRPFRGLNLSVSYAYLNTKIESFTAPDVGAGVFLTPPLVGNPIPNSIPHKVNVSGQYTLPLDDSIGRISLGATYIYTHSYEAVTPSCYTPRVTVPATPNSPCSPGNYNNEGGRIGSYEIVNVNVNWENVARLPIDASFFMTNLTNEKYLVSLNDNSARGFRSGIVGEPRMYGFRLRYRFGQ